MLERAERIKEVDGKIEGLAGKFKKNETFKRLKGEWEGYRKTLGEKIGDAWIKAYSDAFVVMEK